MFSKVLKAESYHADALVYRGLVRFALDHRDLAYLDFDKALRLSPNHTLALLFRGHCNYDSNEVKSALSDFETCVPHLENMIAMKSKAFEEEERAVDTGTTMSKLAKSSKDKWVSERMNRT